MEPLRALLHVGIVVTLSGAATPTEMTELKAEAARLWRPYGIELTWFDHDEDCASAAFIDWIAPVDLLVRLSIEDGAAKPDPRHLLPVPLGAVQFMRGVPEENVHLLYRSIAHMVLDARMSGWPIGLLPPPLRDQFVGRALGRVFAHELGHVLLGAPVHAATGLMRANFSPSDLVLPQRAHLSLTPTIVRRLQRRFAGESLSGS